MNCMCFAAALLCANALAQTPLTTSFTFQAELKSGGTLAAGLHDLRFRLYDAASGGNLVGSELCTTTCRSPTAASRFNSTSARSSAAISPLLEVDVRADTGLNCTNTTGYETLTSRQPLTAAPHAAFSLNASSASNAWLPRWAECRVLSERIQSQRRHSAQHGGSSPARIRRASRSPMPPELSTARSLAPEAA